MKAEIKLNEKERNLLMEYQKQHAGAASAEKASQAILVAAVRAILTARGIALANQTINLNTLSQGFFTIDEGKKE